jgi:hypothetical protein
MEAFWDDLFYDMDECGLTREGFANKAGVAIRDDLRRIEDAIEEHDGKKALALIEEFKQNY